MNSADTDVIKHAMMGSEETQSSETLGGNARTNTATDVPVPVEEHRRKSFKRLLPDSGPSSRTTSKSFKNSASAYWYLLDIIKNVASRQPLLHTPQKALKQSARKRSGQLTCMDFNYDGELIAAGDMGGQVILYHRNSQSYKPSSLLQDDRYRLLIAYQAHDQIFDVMTSCVGESNVTQVKWLRNGKSRSEFLLSAGHKAVKLWKVEQKPKLTYDDDYRSSCIHTSTEDSSKDEESMSTLHNNSENSNNDDESMGTSQLTLTLPKVVNKEWRIVASLRTIYGPPSSYEFNSVSPNSDQETFLAADCVRVTSWNLERGDAKIDLVDFDKVNGVHQGVESWTEIIMAAEFHPTSCNIYAYANSNGLVRLCDLRQPSMQSLQSGGDKVFDGSRTNKFIVAGEFSEVVNSIRHMKFSPSGRYMMTRKYMSLEIWDMNMESRPLETYDVQEWIEPHLEDFCDLYGRANDNFTCDWSFNERRVIAGAYNNTVRIVDRNVLRNRLYKVHPSNLDGFADVIPSSRLRPRKISEILSTSAKCNEVVKRSVQGCACHPKENLIALTSGSNLYLYNTSVEKTKVSS